LGRRKGVLKRKINFCGGRLQLGRDQKGKKKKAWGLKITLVNGVKNQQQRTWGVTRRTGGMKRGGGGNIEDEGIKLVQALMLDVINGGGSKKNKNRKGSETE